MNSDYFSFILFLFHFTSAVFAVVSSHERIIFISGLQWLRSAFKFVNVWFGGTLLPIKIDHHRKCQSICVCMSDSANRGHLRSAARGDLAVPHSITTRYGQRCFAVSGPTLWNLLPLSVCDPSLTLT